MLYRADNRLSMEHNAGDVPEEPCGPHGLRTLPTVGTRCICPCGTWNCPGSARSPPSVFRMTELVATDIGLASVPTEAVTAPGGPRDRAHTPVSTRACPRAASDARASAGHNTCVLPGRKPMKRCEPGRRGSRRTRPGRRPVQVARLLPIARHGETDLLRLRGDPPEYDLTGQADWCKSIHVQGSSCGAGQSHKRRRGRRNARRPPPLRTGRQARGCARHYTGGRLPTTKNTRATISPTTNKIQAICVAVPAMPLKPNSPAMMAITKKVTAHPIMRLLRDADDACRRLRLCKSRANRPAPRRGRLWPGQGTRFRGISTAMFANQPVGIAPTSRCQPIRETHRTGRQTAMTRHATVADLALNSRNTLRRTTSDDSTCLPTRRRPGSDPRIGDDAATAAVGTGGGDGGRGDREPDNNRQLESPLLRDPAM